MTNKKRILSWCDGHVATGFGIVAKNVLKALWDTGLYDIDQLAINYHGDFVDKNIEPWQLVPARTYDQNDPYGNKMFIKTVREREYDYIWIMNDTFVVEQAAQELSNVFRDLEQAGRKVPILIYYYPVDCRVMSNATSMIKLADIPVAYTYFGLAETLKVIPDLNGKIETIYHGTNTEVYKPLPADQIRQARAQFFHLDGDKTLIVNVNRNSQRKQLSQTILAFKEFRKYVPNSMLYLHTNITDSMSRIDLAPLLEHLGLTTTADVIFPVNYNPSNGLPEELMNVIYNCADMFLTTHLGEGWGLTVTEAMAACVPVIAPKNTSMPEILGGEQIPSSRGYLYECKEEVAVDNSGYRKCGHTADIVNTMLEVHKAGFKYTNPRVISARQWVSQNTWKHVSNQWINLFANAKKKIKKVEVAEEV
jgi:D-inositol-3-phosphate glycosyltransferase